MNDSAIFGLDRSPRLPDFDIRGEELFGSNPGPEHFKMEDVYSYQQQQERMQSDPQDHLVLLPSPPPSANHAKLQPTSYDVIGAHDCSSIGTTSDQHVEGNAFSTNRRAFPVLSPNVVVSLPAGSMISPALSTTESDRSLLTTPRDGIALENRVGNTKILINTNSRRMNVGDISQHTLKGVSDIGVGSERGGGGGRDRESWFAAEQDKYLETENFFERYTNIPSPPHTADIYPFYPPHAYERMAPYDEDRVSFEGSGGGGGGAGGGGGDPIKPVTRLHPYQQPSVGVGPMTRSTTPPRASTVSHDNCEPLAAETTSYSRRRRKAAYRGQDAVPENHQNEIIGNPLLSIAGNTSESIDRRNTFNISGVLVHEEDLAILEQPTPVLPQYGRSVDHPLAHYSHQEELLSAPQSSSPTSMKGLGMRLRSNLGSVSVESLVQGVTNQQLHQHQQHQPQRNMSYHSGMVPTPLSGSYLRPVPFRAASPYDAMRRRYSHAVDTMSLYSEDHDIRPFAQNGAMTNYSTELVGSNAPLSAPFGSTPSYGSFSSNLKEPVELSHRKTAHAGMGFVIAEPYPRSRSAPASPDLGSVASHGMTFPSSYMPYANVSLPLFVVTPGITSEHHQSTLDSSEGLNWKRGPRHEHPHPCAREMTHPDDERNGRGNVRRRMSTWGGPATISVEPTSSYIMTADDHETGSSFENECSTTTIITPTTSSTMIPGTSTSLSNGMTHQNQKSSPPSPAAVRLLQQRRSSKVLPPPHAGFAFVNFTASDAKTLSNGVAPSGSSKRKREEEEQHEQERESKIVVAAATTPATPPPPKSTIKKEDENMTGDRDDILRT